MDKEKLKSLMPHTHWEKRTEIKDLKGDKDLESLTEEFGMGYWAMNTVLDKEYPLEVVRAEMKINPSPDTGHFYCHEGIEEVISTLIGIPEPHLSREFSEAVIMARAVLEQDINDRVPVLILTLYVMGAVGGICPMLIPYLSQRLDSDIRNLGIEPIGVKSDIYTKEEGFYRELTGSIGNCHPIEGKDIFKDLPGFNIKKEKFLRIYGHPFYEVVFFSTDEKNNNKEEQEHEGQKGNEIKEKKTLIMFRIGNPLEEEDPLPF
jgi:hypothetical protein